MNRKKLNILFLNLGGVIITLNPQATVIEFSILSGETTSQINDFVTTYPLFRQYEKGLIDNAIFRKGICIILEMDATDEVIDLAWNAMIIGILKERLEWLAATALGIETIHVTDPKLIPVLLNNEGIQL